MGLFQKLTGKGKRKIQILRDFEGLIKSGELLVILGKPGSGCSTLLKTISGETNGFFIDSTSTINYQGTFWLFYLLERQSSSILANPSLQASRKHCQCLVYNPITNHPSMEKMHKDFRGEVGVLHLDVSLVC